MVGPGLSMYRGSCTPFDGAEANESHRDKGVERSSLPRRETRTRPALLTPGWVLLIVVPACPPQFWGLPDEGRKAAPDRASLVTFAFHAPCDHLLTPLQGASGGNIWPGVKPWPSPFAPPARRRPFQPYDLLTFSRPKFRQVNARLRLMG